MSETAPLEQRARLTAKRCERLALRISKEASRISRTEKVLRIINILVGAVAALVTLSGPVAALIGTGPAQAISVIAAVVLILDGLIPYFRQGPSPDRLSDYAFYIHGYAGSLENTLADSGLTDAQRRSRVLALLELAEKNLADVCRNFGTLYDEAITAHEALPLPTISNGPTGNA